MTPDQIAVRVSVTRRAACRGSHRSDSARANNGDWSRGAGYALTEAIFVVITLFGMIGTHFAQQKGHHLHRPSFMPSFTSPVAFSVCVLGIASWRRRTVDIDLLMIMAAIGAVLVGPTVPASCCCSGSHCPNVLQDYASTAHAAPFHP